MSTHTISAADLNRGHLGKTITFSIGEASFTDMLSSVSHDADIIDDSSLFSEVPSYLLGRTETVVGLLRAGEVTVAATTAIELAE